MSERDKLRASFEHVACRLLDGPLWDRLEPHKIAAIADALMEAHDTGIEAAAVWHERQAGSMDGDAPEANAHMLHAEDLRKLKALESHTPPKSPPEC
jgi:hypothetical protein